MAWLPFPPFFTGQYSPKKFTPEQMTRGKIAMRIITLIFLTIGILGIMSTDVSMRFGGITSLILGILIWIIHRK